MIKRSVIRREWNFFVILAPNSQPFVRFKTAMIASPDEVGRFWASETKTKTVFLFSFGTELATYQVDDGWTACCELYLQAQLEERGELQRLCLSGAELFAMMHQDDVVVCSCSSQRNFPVRKAELVDSLKLLVDNLIAKLPDERAEDFVQLGASMIENELRFAPLKTGRAVH